MKEESENLASLVTIPPRYDLFQTILQRFTFSLSPETLSFLEKNIYEGQKPAFLREQKKIPHPHQKNLIKLKGSICHFIILRQKVIIHCSPLIFCTYTVAFIRLFMCLSLHQIVFLEGRDHGLFIFIFPSVLKIFCSLNMFIKLNAQEEKDKLF